MVVRLVLAGATEPVPDETYYWLWAQHLNVGYYDHPPMVAWLIRAGTFLFGDNSFGVRFAFVLSFVGVSWLIYDAAKALFDETVAKRALLWANGALLLSLGTMIATPDPPSVLLWMASVWALVRLRRTQNPRWWLLFGLFAGLGVLAKYTNLFLGLGVIVWLICDKSARHWWRSGWLYGGAVIALMVMSPNIWWNLNHHWVTVIKQFGRVEAHGFTFKYVPELVFSQALTLNPLIAFFAVLAVNRARKTPDAGARMLLYLGAPLVAYMGLHVLHDRIQGNWPAPIYPQLIILGAWSAVSLSHQRLKAWTMPVGFGLCGLVCAVFVANALGVKMPGMVGQNQGWAEVARAVDAEAKAANADTIITTDYTLTGALSYHLKRTGSALPVTGIDAPQRYGWQRAIPAKNLILVRRAKDILSHSACIFTIGKPTVTYLNDQKDTKHALILSRAQPVPAPCSIK
jgi:4-amino-4-deoxy-L-arabinose transferase-like glycosyltransferase